MNQGVIDASVALRWFLPDEAEGEKALELLEGYLNGRVSLICPALLGYEVLNGLIMAGRKGRIPKEIIETAFEGFLQLGIIIKDPFPSYSKLIRYCLQATLTAYDASYLVLAEAEKIPLITADEKLIKAVEKEFSWITRLMDFRIS
jgi:predicted nucleic acid-binding protein